MKTYYEMSKSLEGGTRAIIDTLFETIIPMIIGCYSVFLTGIFLDLIRQRFRHLNEAIIPCISQLSATRMQGEISVYDVRYLHGVLIDSAKLIDMLYGINTLIVFGSILLEFVSIIYIFIKTMQNMTVTMVDLLFQVIYLFAMYHFTTYEVSRADLQISGLISRRYRYYFSIYVTISGKSCWRRCNKIWSILPERGISLGKF